MNIEISETPLQLSNKETMVAKVTSISFTVKYAVISFNPSIRTLNSNPPKPGYASNSDQTPAVKVRELTFGKAQSNNSKIDLQTPTGTSHLVETAVKLFTVLPNGNVASRLRRLVDSRWSFLKLENSFTLKLEAFSRERLNWEIRRNEGEHIGSPPARLNPKIRNRERNQIPANPRNPRLDETSVAQEQIVVFVLDVFVRREAQRLLDADRHALDNPQFGNQFAENLLEGGDRRRPGGWRRSGLGVAEVGPMEVDGSELRRERV
ncbi:hypothetical protein MIMGU_mgv1a012044mg [Erythranthe guttata]|uniref:Uncharacterized protein n=1 Tax=Erythranthe guttata TaxID=4155 RepID=A0A022QVW0_ERYGU|nr:hypothetical protein MIMGU_mgv1a012044mg [Erythranthe guttata]